MSAHSEHHPATLVMAALLVLPAMAAWYAAPLWLMWGWFVVPLGLPPIGFLHAFGLLLVVGALRPGAWSRKRPEDDIDWHRLMWTPLVAMALGWLVRGWM